MKKNTNMNNEVEYRELKLRSHSNIREFFDESCMDEFYEVVEELFFGTTEIHSYSCIKDLSTPRKYIKWMKENEYLAGLLSSDSQLIDFPFESLNIDASIIDILNDQEQKNRIKAKNDKKTLANSRESFKSCYDSRESLDDEDDFFDFTKYNELNFYLGNGNGTWFVIKISQCVDVFINRLCKLNLWSPYLLKEREKSVALSHVTILVNNCFGYTLRRLKDNCLINFNKCDTQIMLVARIWQLISSTLLSRLNSISKEFIENIYKLSTIDFDKKFIDLAIASREAIDNDLDFLRQQSNYSKKKRKQGLYKHNIRTKCNIRISLPTQDKYVTKLNDKISVRAAKIAHDLLSVKKTMQQNNLKQTANNHISNVIEKNSQISKVIGEKLYFSSWVLSQQLKIEDFFYSKITKCVGKTISSPTGLLCAAGGMYVTDSLLSVLGLSLSGVAISVTAMAALAYMGAGFWYEYKQEKYDKEIETLKVDLKKLEERRNNFVTQLTIYYKITNEDSSVTKMLSCLDQNPQSLYDSIYAIK